MKILRRNLAKLGFLGGILAISVPAMAIDITVLENGDTAVPSSASCSDDCLTAATLTCPTLRDAIACTAEDITETAEGYVITLPAGEIDITEGVIEVLGRSVTINGTGRDGGTTIDGNGAQIFAITLNAPAVDPIASLFRVSEMSIVNGVNTGGDGGAINSNGTYVEVDNVNFANNSADGAGGAIYVSGDVANEVLIEDSLFQNNSALNGGALGFDIPFSGEVEVQRTAFFNTNTAVGLGGAIYSGDGVLVMWNSTVQGNVSEGAAPNGAVYFAAGDDGAFTNVFRNVAVTDPLYVGAGRALDIVNTILVDCVVDAAAIIDDQEGNLALNTNACGVDTTAELNVGVDTQDQMGLGVFDTTLGYWPLTSTSPALGAANPGFPVGADQLSEGEDVREFPEDTGPIEFDANGGGGGGSVDGDGGCSLNPLAVTSNHAGMILFGLSVLGSLTFRFRNRFNA